MNLINDFVKDSFSKLLKKKRRISTFPRENIQNLIENKHIIFFNLKYPGKHFLSSP